MRRPEEPLVKKAATTIHSSETAKKKKGYGGTCLFLKGKLTTGPGIPRKYSARGKGTYM